MRRWLSFALLALVFLPATALGEDTYYYQGLDMARAKAHFEAALVRTIPDESLRAIPNLALPVDDDIWFLGAPRSPGAPMNSSFSSGWRRPISTR
ncbi:MAG: hypothetical protein UY82_C0040G0003 [Candidatus Uhrbacteria bacterium GW2011_GWC2_53_7]|uniref:Uncharacterized protein n=1 Tax=Candidatus Uhrbacteria bacterium GW2011_GWC2_53_7 TaxID=1618986 RepID=A0A0G1XWR3_9BACT|nr:MAG: hypothetical protein UY82_C0040G0003 [Candidatus Uhrbacteria bacterium GW2011_GWC2_53_7]